MTDNKERDALLLEAAEHLSTDGHFMSWSDAKRAAALIRKFARQPAALAASQEKAEVVGRKIGYIKIGTDGCPRAQLTTSYDAAGNVWADATPIYDAPVAAQAHPDDAAVDRFAIAMKEKLAIAREKGRSGWEKMDPAELSLMLRQHVEKGDPRDVANFCMFLWALGERIGVARASEPASPQVFGGGNG